MYAQEDSKQLVLLNNDQENTEEYEVYDRKYDCIDQKLVELLELIPVEEVVRIETIATPEPWSRGLNKQLLEDTIRAIHDKYPSRSSSSSFSSSSKAQQNL